MNNDFSKYYFDYIGASGDFPVIDYIDYTSNILNTKIDNISGSGGIYSNLYYQTYEINSNNPNCLIKSIIDNNTNYKHTYILNQNPYGEIRFTNVYVGTSNSKVIIDKFGKLNVFHQYNLLTPSIAEGWLDVEGQLATLAFGLQINIGDVVVVQGQIAGIDASISFIMGELTTLQAYNRAINLNLETLSYGIFNADAYNTLVLDSFTNLTGFYSTRINQFSTIATSQRFSQFVEYTAIPAGVAGVVGALMYSYDMTNLHNITSNILNSNVNLTNTQRRQIIEPSSNLIRNNYLSYNSNFCNMSLEQGFINSNITNIQLIPQIRTNKIIFGNDAPNVAYQLQLTGDANMNMLYINNTSLTSLLNQKQGNLTFNNPLLNTTNTITLKKDSSLTLDGSGNLSVVKTASAPLAISAGHNFSLSYDSTLTLSGSSLSVASGTGSKWTTSSTNIYNNNTGNVGIGLNAPNQKLSVNGIIESINANSTKLIFAYDTNNGYRHSILTGHDAGANDNNYYDFNVWTYGQSAGTLGNKLLTRFHSKYTQFYGNRYLYINDENSVITGYNHSTAPLTIFHKTATSTTILNDSLPILNLAREGTNGQAYGARANFNICRWENGGTSSVGSRTRLDLKLAHDAYDDINLMTWKSNGKVGINNTSPLVELNINKPSASSSLIQFTNTTTGTALTDGSLIGIDASGNYSIVNQENNPILFATNNVERLRITEAGNVGIKTTSPSYDLDIWGSSAYDAMCALRIYNNASTFGRAHLYLIGRYEGGNDGWNLSGGRNNIIFGYKTSQGSAITYPHAIQSVSGNQLGFFSSAYSTTTPAMNLDTAGALNVNKELRVAYDVWHRSLDGKDRFYYGNNGRSYYNSGDGHEFRQNQTATLVLNSAGACSISPDWVNKSVALRSGYMTGGSLTIGDISVNFGGGNNWNANTAGLMMECANNTEIAVHDSGTRIASLFYYEGGANYNIYVGRDMGYGKPLNFFVNASYLSFAGTYWSISVGSIATSPANSLIFLHYDGYTYNSKWWLNGAQTNTSSEISDERIKKDIKEIDDASSLLLKIKPKEYNLCEDKDINRKFGIIAQDIEKEEELKEFIFKEPDYIANILSYGEYIKEKIGETKPNLDPNINYEKTPNNPTPPPKEEPKEIFRYLIKTEKNLKDIIKIDDEIKIVLNNEEGNKEIIIDDTPYNNRYKRRYVKVINFIDDFTIEIDKDIDVSEDEKDKIFIYGSKVDDFHKLDYQSLYCLNIKATQELIIKNRQLEERLKRLEGMFENSFKFP